LLAEGEVARAHRAECQQRVLRITGFLGEGQELACQSLCLTQLGAHQVRIPQPPEGPELLLWLADSVSQPHGL
jgi:hypothetical protein